MVDLNLFATQLVQGGTKGGSGAALFSGLQLGQTIGAGNAASGDAADKFIDSIIKGLIAEDTLKTAANRKENQTISGEIALDQDATIADRKVKSETIDLALLQLGLLGQDPNKSLEDKISELAIENVAKRLDNRTASLEKFVQLLTSGLPRGDYSEQSTRQLIDNLQKRLEKLEAKLDSLRAGDINSPDSPFHVLIATGLNPNQLTDITNRIEEVENKLGRELTLEDIIAGVGSIIPPQKSNNDEDNNNNDTSEFGAFEAYALIRDIIIGGNTQAGDITDQATQTSETTPEDAVEFAEQIALLAKAAVATNNNKTNTVASGSTTHNNTPSNENKPDAPKLPEQASLHAVLAHTLHAQHTAQVDKGESFSASFTVPGTRAKGEALGLSLNAKANIASSSGNATKGNIQAQANLQKNMATAIQTQGTPSNLSAGTDITGDMNLGLTGMELAGFDIETGLPFSQIAQAAHLTTLSTGHAGHPHPATKMVSAHITKAAKAGDNQSITLQLDPPDLGRVEVKLEFGHDKAVKAHLVVEKPETLMLLQRDANALERALQDSGLEADQNSLSFEMAEEGKDFFAGKDSQNSNSHGSNTEKDGEEDETGTIIETSMTWNVDPATGHVRYSILA